jgi:hypothetical protein
MNMPKRTLKSRTITVDDYYSERFLHIETELKHQRELMKLGFETMDKRFESSNKRLDDLRADMNTRFEAVDKRFESFEKRFDVLTGRMDSFMKWSFGMTLTCTGLIIAAMKLWK